MKIKYALAAFSTVVMLAGCAAGGGTKAQDDDDDEWSGSGGGGGAVFDLDSKSAFWLTYKGGYALILYTYSGDAYVGIDVRASPKGPTEGQYNGSRLGTLTTGYTLDLECLNQGITPACDKLGNTMKLSCTSVAGPQLVCGSMVFTKVTYEDIEQQ